jgi:hypothetical protein
MLTFEFEKFANEVKKTIAAEIVDSTFIQRPDSDSGPIFSLFLDILKLNLHRLAYYF